MRQAPRWNKNRFTSELGIRLSHHPGAPARWAVVAKIDAVVLPTLWRAFRVVFGAHGLAPGADQKSADRGDSLPYGRRISQ